MEQQQVTFFLCLVVGFIFGGAVVWLILRTEISQAYGRAKAEGEAERAALNERITARDTVISELKEITGKNQQIVVDKDKHIETLQGEIATLRAREADLAARMEESEKAVAEKMRVLDESQAKLSDTFKALSAEALQTNNAAFLQLANTTLERYQEGARGDLEARQRAIDEMVKPLQTQLDELERTRVNAYFGLNQQISSLAETQARLHGETSKLAGALRMPMVRGRWGELQLRRVVEFAGMVEHCHFEEQVVVEGEEGRQRPDMIVKLPNDRVIVVDSKASLSAYLESLEASNDEDRLAKLRDHARLVRQHLASLGDKAYWEQFPTAEFVVAFLPGECFFSAALEQEPELIEFGVDQRVILATPTTLIALLKAVAYGWRQERLAQNAKAISELGTQLYGRMRALAENLQRVGDSLGRTVGAYNQAVGTFESRALVSARRFKELGAASGGDIESIRMVNALVRGVQAEPTEAPPASSNGHDAGAAELAAAVAES